MEQRSESRVNLNEPRTMTAFRNDDTIDFARFVESSFDGIRIKSHADSEVGSLLRLEVGDDVMMVEVRHCEPDEGEYSAGPSILAWLEKSELNRLLRETAGLGAPLHSTPGGGRGSIRNATW